MRPSPQQILQAIQEEFEQIIDTKTGWGKHEIMSAFEKAKTNALLRFIGD